MNFILKTPRHFASIYLLFLGSALFFQQFLPGYLRYSVIEAISYKIDDGWCNPRTEGIGSHCFGDFYYPLTFVDLDNPWKGVINPYPPISLIIYKPFNFISQSGFPRLALCIFLLLLLICLMFPILHLRFVAKEISFPVFINLLLVTLMCAPALMSLDRGNNQLIMIPFLYLFFRSCLQRKQKNIFFYALICLIIKPQMAILSILIYQISGLRKTLSWLIGSGILYLVSFLIYYKSFPINVIHWVYRVLTFQDYAGRGILMPVNVSIGSDIDVFLNIVNLSVSRNTVKVFVYFLMFAFTFLLLKRLNKRSIMHNFILVLFFPLLFTGTAFHYYLCILYVPFLYHFAGQSQNKLIGSIQLVAEAEVKKPVLSQPLPSISFLAFSIASFVPWGIPWSAFFPNLKGRGWDVIGVNWIFSQYLLLIFAFVMIMHRPKGTNGLTSDKVKG